MVELRVFGAGVFGLSIAWEAARRGARVEVVDPFGVGAGASGGVVGALAPHVPENWNPKKQIQFESLEMAEGFWAEITATGGTDPGYARSGRVQPIVDDAGLALARARSVTADALWQGRYHWRVVDQAEIAAPIPSPTGWLIYDSLSARIHPRRACMALADAILARGGRIVTEASPHAAITLWATGAADLATLSQAMGRNMGQGVKGQAALLAHDFGRDAPQLFVDAVHIVPHADGTLAIGSTSENDFDHPTGTDGQLDALIARARTLCPVLCDAPVIARWAGLRPRARSRAPMLGAHPLAPGAFIANGGFKIGFGMAPMVARLMVDLMLEGRDAIPDSFRVAANL